MKRIHSPTRALLLALLGAACGSPSAVDPPAGDVAPCLTAYSACQERVALGGSLWLPVYRSFSLASPNPRITRALVMIHGADRNADGYFRTAVLATRDAGQEETTLVVAPHFQTSDDGPASDEPYWSSSGWKKGHLSSTEGPQPRVSSYAAVDRILEALLDRTRFPSLATVVVAGHSAGGQVVHRYAATSAVEGHAGGVSIRYVVANPSTYLYLRPERPDGDGFSVPVTSGCPDFDAWHYGLEARNTYASSESEATLSARLSQRDVRILLGDADSLSASLDVSCGANLQGAYRYVRGRALVRFMDLYFPEHHHRQMVVAGVGHSSSGMFRSDVGRLALFGG